MHELSIAQSIVELAEQHARAHHSSVVEEVELEIGCLAGVEADTFAFALESAVKNTWLENAVILRRYIEGEGCCSECGKKFPLADLYSPCPDCGSYFINITQGRELRIKSIVVR